ncbi:hypothetical protein SUGI_0561280 [Cryptomeria japonica]|nr:hypothetical protein SUGI_0561280 [Cryptomeria japonica]
MWIVMKGVDHALGLQFHGTPVSSNLDLFCDEGVECALGFQFHGTPVSSYLDLLCDEGVEHALGFQFHGTPVSSNLDLFPQTHLHYASTSLESLPSEKKSFNEKTEGRSPNSLDLNKTPPSNGQDYLQKDFNVDNGLLRISNEQEKVGIKGGQGFSEEQYAYLEEYFKENNKLSEDYIQREALANKLTISPRQDQVRFQNKRRRNKRNENEMIGTKGRFRFSEEQYAYLEECFKQNDKMSEDYIQVQALANQLNITRQQVQVWFQNRRRRNRKKQNEMDSEAWERISKALREENKRMQKELAEIKAAATPSGLVTLVACPSCQTVYSNHSPTCLTTSE